MEEKQHLATNETNENMEKKGGGGFNRQTFRDVLN